MQELVLTPAGMDDTFDNTFFLNDTSTIAIPYDDDQPMAVHQCGIPSFPPA